MPPSELTLLMYARKVSTRAAYSTAAGPVMAAVIPTLYGSWARAGVEINSRAMNASQARTLNVPAIGLLLRLGMRFGAEPGEFGLRQPGLVCGVHGLYQVAVALVHEAALHLRQVPVGLVHLPRDEVQHPGLAHEACEVGIDHPVGPRPLRPRAGIDLDQGDRVPASFGEHDGLADVGARFQLVLDVGGGQVLSPRRPPDVALAVHELERAAPVQLPHLPHMEPPVLDGLPRRVLVPPVPAENSRAVDQDLAVGPQPHAVDRRRGPHIPRAREARTLAGDDPAGLRRAVQVD